MFDIWFLVDILLSIGVLMGMAWLIVIVAYANLEWY